MKIGIFGGSFNPPHRMHLQIAIDLIEKGYLDKVIYVPTGTKYPKQYLSTDENRLHMLKLMIEGFENIDVSDYELKNNLVYTYQTLDYFKERYPDDEIYFILGNDLFREINTWKKADYILKTHRILMTIRNGDKKEELENLYPDYKSNIVITDIIPRELSSTKIREAIKVNNIKFLEENLDRKVLDYIIENKLYIED